MRRSAIIPHVGLGFAAALLASSASAAAQDAATAADEMPPVSAIRVEREVEMVYMAFTSFYSCDGLRSKVRRVLEGLGMGEGLEVRVRNCIRVTGPEVMPALHIVAQVPVEATPEVLAALEAEAGRRELVARVQGVAPQEATGQFPARRRRVVLESDPLGDLQDGDCELVEQLRDRVFPKLGVRVVEDRTQCTPRQVSLRSIHTVVEVLEPLPAPAPAPAP